MEQAFYLILIPFAILAFWLWRTNKKLERIKNSISKLQKGTELIQGKIRQMGTVDLDVAMIQSQAEENNAQLDSFVRQEVSRLDSDTEELAEKLEELEERLDLAETAIGEDEDESEGEEIIRGS